MVVPRFILETIVKRGVADISLRPLAKAVNSSPRVLLYDFGSKQEQMLKTLDRLRERQRVTFDSMKSADFARPSDACLAIWRLMSSPKSEPLFRIFFEAYSMGLRHPKKFGDFLRTSVEDWLNFIAAPFIRSGHSRRESRAYASAVLAGFHGFMLDYCASHDRKRIDLAVQFWVEGLDAIHPNRRAYDGK